MLLYIDFFCSHIQLTKYKVYGCLLACQLYFLLYCTVCVVRQHNCIRAYLHPKSIGARLNVQLNVGTRMVQTYFIPFEFWTTPHKYPNQEIKQTLTVVCLKCFPIRKETYFKEIVRLFITFVFYYFFLILNILMFLNLEKIRKWQFGDIILKRRN